MKKKKVNVEELKKLKVDQNPVAGKFNTSFSSILQIKKLLVKHKRLNALDRVPSL